MKTVYIELFLIDNILINYYFLYLSGAMLRRKIKRLPALASAGIGSIYGYFQLVGYDFLSNLFLKILLSALMVYISYTPKKATMLKLLLCFYGFSFAFAGCVFAFYYSTSADSFLRNVFFLPVPLRFAMAILLCGHFLKSWLLKIMSYLTYCKQGISIYLPCLPVPTTLSCYSDTGNMCTYFGKPVAFVDKRRLDKATMNIINNISWGNISHMDENINDNSNINVVFIPYKNAGGSISTALGFKCEKALIFSAEKTKELCVYIALTDHDFDGEPCLINPALLD